MLAVRAGPGALNICVMMKKLIAELILLGLLITAVYMVVKPKGPGEGLFSAKSSTEEQKSGETVVVYFKNGNTLIGELLEKTEDRYYVRWKGEEIIVYAEQVERIGGQEEIAKEKRILSDEEISNWWPYENDIVIRLTNRMVCDARITRAGKDKLTLLYLTEGQGRIEQDIERSKVEYLIFKPMDNDQSKRIENSLREMFPEMKFYKEGNFTIVTDSYLSWVKEYRKTLRETYTNVYLKFFNLFKDRKPQTQNFIVIFDDFADFVEYAIADGVPGWAVAGYFSPDEEVLYLFNVLGDKFSEILFEAMVGESGRTINDIVDKVEEHVDERYHIFIKGQAKRIKDKFWNAYSYYKGIFREATMGTLRHEFTHELFHNWGLQNIDLSKVKTDREELIKRKKEIFETEDYKKKAKLIKALISLRGESLDMQAANSWLAEGTATYCETDPPGSRNNRWLFIYQEMLKEGSVYPLESLTYYKIGSFPGVCPKAMLQLYAQSWAYVTFLMEKYPEQFMDYQKRMAKDLTQEHEDIDWLLEELGKDLRTVEKEFVEYMNTYEQVDDPYVSSFVKLYDIFRE